MTRTIPSIRASVTCRGISRLCHFTPSRNLSHIAEGRRGVLATRHLTEDEKTVFNATDVHRLDGHRDHVSCSIHYPNAWYFRTARGQERLFRDWIVLLIDSHYLWRTGTKFCPRNAAAGHGRSIGEGIKAFEALFATIVEGARTYRRGPNHPAFLPTDEQAEVLVPDQIQPQDVIGIAVADDAQAGRELSRLHLLSHRPPPILIVPEFYDPNALSRQLRAGRIPCEREHQGGGIDG